MTNRRAFTARLPERSHDILEKLSERYGSKTQAVVVALDDLYAREHKLITRDERPPLWWWGPRKGQNDE